MNKEIETAIIVETEDLGSGRNFCYFSCISHLTIYRALQGFGQAKFPDGGLALGSSQFSILPQLHEKLCLLQNGSNLTQK